MGSNVLRVAISRFANVDDAMVGDAWGTPYRGEGVVNSSIENAMCEHIRDGTWRATSAEQCLEEFAENAGRPYYSREDFVRVVAAIATLHPEEVQKVAYKGCTVRSMLVAACQASNVEWMLNFTRFVYVASSHQDAASERNDLGRGLSRRAQRGVQACARNPHELSGEQAACFAHVEVAHPQRCSVQANRAPGEADCCSSTLARVCASLFSS